MARDPLIGLVGKPSSGKSTTLNSLTDASSKVGKCAARSPHTPSFGADPQQETFRERPAVPAAAAAALTKIASPPSTPSAQSDICR